MNRRTNRLSLVLLCAVLLPLLTCGLSGLAAWPGREISGQIAAERRWDARAFDSYQMTVQAEVLGVPCYQRITVHGEVVRLLFDSCGSTWLQVMTPRHLFRLNEQVQEIPSSRCFPTDADCYCHRVFTNRSTIYDTQYGYPAEILSRSEVRFNWRNAAFWRYIAANASLPSCSSSPRLLLMKVISFTSADS